MVYVIFYKPGCPYSEAAVKLLSEKDIHFDIYQMDIDGKKHDFSNKEFKEKFGHNATYPRIYKNNRLIGGYMDLREHLS